MPSKPKPKHPTAAKAAIVNKYVVLGKLEPKNDSRDLMLETYAERDELLPHAPSHAAWARRLHSFPMYGNDALPDCTCAAVGHGERVFSAAAGRPEEPTLDDVLRIFDATGPRDDGRYCNDILNYWRNVGFGVDGEKIFAYVKVDPRDRKQVELAIWLFGGLYIGLDLPVSAQRQTHWHIDNSNPGRAEPGSWGGHCVWIPGFTKERGLTCITWGERMTMTWGFWRKYCDEAFAVLSPDWADGTRKAPSGFNLDALKSDLNAL